MWSNIWSFPKIHLPRLEYYQLWLLSLWASSLFLFKMRSGLGAELLMQVPYVGELREEQELKPTEVPCDSSCPILSGTDWSRNKLATRNFKVGRSFSLLGNTQKLMTSRRKFEDAKAEAWPEARPGSPYCHARSWPERRLRWLSGQQRNSLKRALGLLATDLTLWDKKQQFKYLPAVRPPYPNISSTQFSWDFPPAWYLPLLAPSSTVGRAGQGKQCGTT